jgi:hypothetical protein
MIAFYFIFCLLLSFDVSLHLFLDGLEVFCSYFIAAVFCDFLLSDSILHDSGDLLFHLSAEDGVGLVGDGHDGLVHLLDPVAFAFVADLQVDGEVFLQNLPELLSGVVVVEGQGFVVLLHCLLALL